MNRKKINEDQKKKELLEVKNTQKEFKSENKKRKEILLLKITNYLGKIIKII